MVKLVFSHSKYIDEIQALRWTKTQHKSLLVLHTYASFISLYIQSSKSCEVDKNGYGKLGRAGVNIYLRKQTDDTGAREIESLRE